MAMKRFLFTVALLALALALPGCARAASPVDDEANVPTWAQAIRDSTGAEYMAVYANHAFMALRKEHSEKHLGRALGDFTREADYFHGKIFLSVMTWDQGGELSHTEMRELQWHFREAAGRYYLKIWPK